MVGMNQGASGYAIAPSGDATRRLRDRTFGGHDADVPQLRDI